MKLSDLRLRSVRLPVASAVNLNEVPLIKRLKRAVQLRIAGLKKVEPPLDYTADRLPNYNIGRGTYGQPHLFRYPNDANLEIGAFCSIALDVSIFLGGNHHPEWVSTFPFGAMWPEYQHPDQPISRGDVVIGNDVWIGREALILSGVTIGDGAVIGARAVVSKNIPPYGIAVGNPAQVIRYRFSQEIIARLLEIRWWEWPDKRLRSAITMLQSPDIGAFIKAVDRCQI